MKLAFLLTFDSSKMYCVNMLHHEFSIFAGYKSQYDAMYSKLHHKSNTFTFFKSQYDATNNMLNHEISILTCF